MHTDWMNANVVTAPETAVSQALEILGICVSLYCKHPVHDFFDVGNRTTMKNVLLALFILFLTSCGHENTLSTESPNASESQFKWDFSNQREFIYSFFQTVKSESIMEKERPPDKSSLTGNGNLKVRVKENHLANLSLTDLKMKMIVLNEDGTPGDTLTTQKAPPNVAQDMKPDGSFGDSNSDMLYGMLFPLPRKFLKEGESYELPMQMPFNVFGTTLFSKGYNKLTFIGYENIAGRKCAVLKGEIDISRLDVPEEMKGEYHCSSTGSATYYFNLENGYYVGADVQMVIDVMVDLETENEDDFGSFMKMKSDNSYKIRLEEIDA